MDNITIEARVQPSDSPTKVNFNKLIAKNLAMSKKIRYFAR